MEQKYIFKDTYQILILMAASDITNEDTIKKSKVITWLIKKCKEAASLVKLISVQLLKLTTSQYWNQWHD